MLLEMVFFLGYLSCSTNSISCPFFFFSSGYSCCQLVASCLPGLLNFFENYLMHHACTVEVQTCSKSHLVHFSAALDLIY